MECISLEEDNCGIVGSQQNANSITGGGIIFDGMDFQSPVTSVLRGFELHYLDISDDDFEFPSSQREYQEMQK